VNSDAVKADFNQLLSKTVQKANSHLKIASGRLLSLGLSGAQRRTSGGGMAIANRLQDLWRKFSAAVLIRLPG